MSSTRPGPGTDTSPRYLVCPDSFKGTIAAPDVAAAIGAGLRAAGAAADLCPVADGGEGTAATVREALGGVTLTAPVHDPTGAPLTAELVLVEDGATAIVDTAAASGLALVAPERRDAEAASTYGTGELIAAAIEAGARRVLVAAGGSATTDGGRGAIEALRERGGLGGATLEVLCDVSTPFEEAARVFAPQKGADEAAVARLSGRLQDFATELPRDPRGVPMTGCAGGLSGGLCAAFGANLRPGAEYVLELLDFDARLRAADAAITGEGRIDSQSLEGKIVGRIATASAHAGRPLHVVVGRNDLDPAAARELSIRSIREAGTIRGLEVAGGAIVGEDRALVG
jgi:glycerate kinase